VRPQRNILCIKRCGVASLNSVLLYFLLQSPVYSDEYKRLLQSGYNEIWSGYAPITTCTPEHYIYKIGPYTFECEKYSYEYVYHYGTVILMMRGGSHKLCLEGAGKCLSGEIKR
jgi:hypothetical protein